MMQAKIRGARKQADVVAWSVAASFGAAILIAGAIILVVPNSVQAKPEFAAKTGLPCGQCHVSPAGGGKLKSFGEAFKNNGFNLPKRK